MDKTVGAICAQVLGGPLGSLTLKTARQLRVAHVVPGIGARTGGPASSVLATALALNRAGVHAEVFTTDIGTAASARHIARLRPEDIDAAIDFPIYVAQARQPLRLAYAPELRRELARRAGDFDVIHIHSLFLYPQYAAYRVAQERLIPYVVSPRGALDPYLRGRGRIRKAITDAVWQHRMLSHAAAIHLTADKELELVADIAPKVRRCVIPNPVDWRNYVDLPDPKAFTDRYLGGQSPPIVMYLGRISHKKQIGVLIEAFARIAPLHPNAALVIIGPDDEGLTPQLRQVATQLGISSRTTFIDHLAGGEKLAALAAATVWVLPSATENFGVAAVEALAAGVPVIISPGVNISGELRELGACIVCEPEPAALAAEISALLKHPDRRLALATAGRRAARRFSPEKVAAQMTGLYESVLR
jgi:glycosyltransferase involved in cell wall biosynthesis